MSSPEVNTLLSFALYGAANRLVRMYKPFLDPLGLTFPQYLVVLELLGHAPRSVGELGGRLGMDTGTITPLIKRLDQAGFVARQGDTHDERKVLVTLTFASEASPPFRNRLRRRARFQTSVPKKSVTLWTTLDGHGEAELCKSCVIYRFPTSTRMMNNDFQDGAGVA